MAYDGTLKFDTSIDSKGFQSGIDGIGSIAEKGLKATGAILAGTATAIGAIGAASVNSIYPINLHELEVRRDYQTAAIGACEKMLQELQYIIEVLPVDANKLLRYVDMIDKEVALLKGWRKANGKIAKRLDKQQEGNQKQKPSKCKNQP